MASVAFALGAILASAAHAADRQQVTRAVERGVAFLQSAQSSDGAWFTYSKVGATALAGLTLLECAVPEGDPAVRKAAEYVRHGCIDIEDIHTTYCLSLAILFLDRLGDPMDVPLIQSLAVRVLAGQNASGGWSYHCPSLGAEENQRLKTLVQRRAELVARGELPKPGVRERKARPELPQEIQQLLSEFEKKGPAAPGRFETLIGQGGDNSNTQFAVLALWAARRQGIPVEKVLARTEARFRQSQNSDGGWGYRLPNSTLPVFGSSTASMSCAGLLGMAFGYGSASETRLRTEPSLNAGRTAGARLPQDPTRDPVIRGGFLALGKVMAQPMTAAELQGLVLEQGVLRNVNVARDYYFLWSLERVAVGYGVNTIAGKDWYNWGAAALLSAQQQDGSWKGKFGTDIDTCFALLFLRRANLAPDLTAYLKGQVKDPGQATLKSSGAAETSANAKPSAGRPARAAAAPAGSAQTPTTEPDARKLSQELLQAAGSRQEQLLARLRDNKGVAYTDALAAAIPQLKGAVRNKAREALAERLSRMTAATLRDKLADEDAEIRRAAALACTVKGDKDFVPDLIRLLDDSVPAVARAALAALKELSGQDLGASGDKWKAWWKKK
jgi:hypothetical protein